MKQLLKRAIGWGLAANSGIAAAATEPGLTVMSTMVSLLVVLAAIGVVAFLFKRIGPGGAPQTRMMRVVSQLSLGAREKISVVEVDDQWLVLGVTSQQITLLTQTAKKDVVATPQTAINFSTLLNLARKK